jgi:acyl-CoA thioesterase I
MRVVNQIVTGTLVLLALAVGGAALGQNLLLKDRQQVILLGDSLTEGEDPDGYVNTTRLILAQVYPEMVVFTANAGKGGNTSADLEDRLQRDVLQFKPDWVTISIGVNDINQRFGGHPAGDGTNGVRLPAFKEKVSSLVQRIQANGGKVLLCSGTVIKEDLSSPENQQMEMYSAALREVAKEKQCLLADTRQAFREVLAPLQKPGMPESGVLTVDGVHLLPRGSWLMARTLVAAWGVPPERMDLVRPAVEEQIRKQTEELNRRLARYRRSNYEVGLPCEGQPRVVMFGASAVEYWDFTRDFPHAQMLNRGIGGETTRQMRLRFVQDVVALKPTGVIIFLGSGNDFWPENRMSVVDTKSYLARIARLAKGSGIHLAIASLIPASDHLPKKDFIRSHPLAVVQELNRWIEGLCREKGYVFMDFYHPVAGPDGKLRRDFTDDGLHCNAAGYAALKPLVEKALMELK